MKIYLRLDGHEGAVILSPPSKSWLDKIWPIMATDRLPNAIRDAAEIDLFGGIGGLDSLEKLGRLGQNTLPAIFLALLLQLRGDDNAVVNLDGSVLYLDIRFDISRLAVRKAGILEAVQIGKIARLGSELNATALPFVKERSLQSGSQR